MSLAVFLAATLAVGVLGTTSCAHGVPAGAGGGAGITLARDWVLQDAEGNVSTPLTWANADKRYAKLTGAAFTGAVTMAAGLTLSGTADLTLGASVDLNLGNSATSAIRGGNNALQRMDDALGWYAQYSAATSLLMNAVTNTFVGPTGSAGVALASFPACAAAYRGRADYDTTNKVTRECNNGALNASDQWRPPAMASFGATGYAQNTLLGFFRSGDVVSPEATDYMGMGWSSETTDNVHVLGGSLATISCAWETVGVTGAAATGVVMELTNGTNTCSCTLNGGTATCAVAVRTNNSCDCTWSGTSGGRLSALTAGNKGFKLQMKNTTDCGTNPRNVQCTVYTAAGPI